LSEILKIDIEAPSKVIGSKDYNLIVKVTNLDKLVQEKVRLINEIQFQVAYQYCNRVDSLNCGNLRFESMIMGSSFETSFDENDYYKMFNTIPVWARESISIKKC